MSTIIGAMFLVAVIVFISTSQVACRYCGKQRMVWGKPCCETDNQLVVLEQRESALTAWQKMKSWEQKN